MHEDDKVLLWYMYTMHCHIIKSIAVTNYSMLVVCSNRAKLVEESCYIMDCNGTGQQHGIIILLGIKTYAHIILFWQ